MSSAFEILLLKSTEFQQLAQQQEEENNHQEALHLYQRASEILLGLLNNEPDEGTKVNIALRLKTVLERKEKVKEALEQLDESKTPVFTSEIDHPTTCEVILSVENISVHQILGSEQLTQRRRLVGKGVIKILKCSSPDEFHMLQMIPEDGENQFQLPLTKSVPCLCTSPGYYIFPMPGEVFYGIVFPKEIPGPYYQVFEKVLEECCCLRKLPVPVYEYSQDAPVYEPQETESAIMEVSPEATTVTTITSAVDPNHPQALQVRAMNKVSVGITTGAEYLVEGITVGSQILAKGAQMGGEFIKNRITPATTPVRVPAKVANTIAVAGKVSPVCVAVSKALINSLAVLAEQIGSAVADNLVKTTLGKKAAKKDGPTAQAAKEVGRSSLQAFVDVWEACEKAGRLLLKETSNVTVEIVQKKYGDEVAQATKESLAITGDVIETAYNMDQVGIKKIAKKAAKHAGRKTVHNWFGEGEEPQPALPAPPVYPQITAPPTTIQSNSNQGAIY